MQIVFEDPDMQEIFEGFVVETNELIDSLQAELMKLEDGGDDMELLNSIFRSFHTIKGTAGFMGFDDIASTTHHAEDLLNKLRKAELVVTSQTVDVLFDVLDVITQMLSNKTEGTDVPIHSEKVVKHLEILSSGKEIPAEDLAAEDIPKETLAPEEEKAEAAEGLEGLAEEPASSEVGGDGEDTLSDILDDGSFGDHDGYYTDDELDLIQQAFAQINEEHKKVNAEKSSTKDEEEDLDIEETIEVHEEGDAFAESFAEPNIEESATEVKEPEIETAPVLDVKEKVEEKPAAPDLKVEEKSPAPGKAPAAAKTPTKAPGKSSETIRIDVDRVQTLLDLSGELVLARNRLSQISELLDSNNNTSDVNIRDLLESMDTLDLLTSDIQTAVMKMRMVPVAKLYQKAPRIVRDLGRGSGKKIKLVVKGEETEIDRGIIEELNDPLTHMIRNSCDHGIELAEDRLAKGKEEEGIITLDADQEGNNIVLKISDNGAGLDAVVLKAKAMERGIITQEQSDTMSDKEAFSLIFAPGFSTAKQVTSVSGRGVGMDVVRTNIQKLKGMVEIESKKGVGTTFIIKLPLTLAIIQGLLVKVDKDIYAIPLNSVVEVVSVNESEIKTVNHKEVIRIREEVLPILYMDKALNIMGENSGREEKTISEKYVVNVSVGVQSMGLIVDKLIGQEEIVIKSLGNYLGSIKGIAGSTILGDGRPIMILDIPQLLDLVYANDYASVL